MTAYNVLSHVEPQHQITTDACLLGRGAEHEGYPLGGNGPMLKPSTTKTTWKC